jgi:hypothetical protein
MERIFLRHYTHGAHEVEFRREDIESVAHELDIKLPKNVGDLIYSFRYRTDLPEAIRRAAPEGRSWIIRPAGRGLYCFVAVAPWDAAPNELLAETKVPDSTPGLIEMYALSDEQALLAKLRYNRLVDLFTGVTCYSLQSHLRTTVPGMGQVETDEVYIGVDRRGAHYVFPVQAKAGRERLGLVQIEQDCALAAHRFPALVCRPIGAQFMCEALIALFEFEMAGPDVKVVAERHYRLVPPEELSPEEIQKYRNRPD